MGDHKGGIDLVLEHAVKQVVGPAIDMGLPRADRQSLVHHSAERDFVDEAAINARDRDHAGRRQT